MKALKELVFGKPIGLSLYYKVVAADEMLESLAERFREDPNILAAYIKPGVEPPILDSNIAVADGLAPGFPTKDLTSFQRYLNAASEGGVDARVAWSREGGTGKNVNIIDIEGAWQFTHEDLKDNQGGVVGGIPIASREWRNHGTAVLGIFSGDLNDFGITGICPDANVSAISIFGNSQGSPTADWGAAAAIRQAADKLNPGDIMLIELHYPGPR
ncbi:MAG TPA: hypothetical protein VKB86_00745, partial [Pyrinomonadaceae bacterium]|nr:hypothetical protein [Pyrinomonadaceae bacterium]